MFGSNPRNYLLRIPATIFLVAIFGTVIAVLPAFAQTNELSLADILIALRSKKATLPEKNKILAEAIRSRGTTFTLTPEIEKELANSGADPDLIGSLRKRQEKALAATTAPPRPTTVEQPPVPPPDAAFYEKRAIESEGRGDLESALNDYNKAIEMNPKAVSAIMSRAAVNAKKNSLDAAIADYNRVIEIDGRNINALLRRAESHEKNKSLDLAVADYKTVTEIDPANALAVENYARLKPAPPKPVAVETKSATATAQPPTSTVRPTFVDVGRIQESMYARMSKPTYPEIALKSRVSGQVFVSVEIDENGEVTSAKATSGHAFLKEASEYAARRAKFKPILFEGFPIRARGVIVYNFATTNR